MIKEHLEGPGKTVWLYSLCHGKDTPGKRGPVFQDNKANDFQIKEWVYGRDIIARVVDINLYSNSNFVIINPEDEDISVREKTYRANKIIFDLRKKGFYPIGISLHGNAASTAYANGVEIFTSIGQTKSDKIADIFGSFYENLDMNFRKDFWDISIKDLDKEKNFWELVRTHCPWILPEIGFYTNRKDAVKMNDPHFRDIVAKLTWSAQRRVEEKVELNLI